MCRSEERKRCRKNERSPQHDLAGVSCSRQEEALSELHKQQISAQLHNGNEMFVVE